jgi:hypothetical protein
LAHSPQFYVSQAQVRDPEVQSEELSNPPALKLDLADLIGGTPKQKARPNRKSLKRENRFHRVLESR